MLEMLSLSLRRIFFFSFFQKEKKILETKRLDLDASKTRLRKAKSTSQPQVIARSLVAETIHQQKYFSI